MTDTRWTLKQWKEAVGESPNWEIFEIPAEVIEKRELEQDYSIKYVGPIENGTTVEEVPEVPLLYKTFAGIKELVEIPLGLRMGLNYDIVVGCEKFNPSIQSLHDLLINRSWGWCTTDFLNGTGSPNIIEISEVISKPSTLVSKLLGLDQYDVHQTLVNSLGDHFDNYDDHTRHSVFGINDFVSSQEFLRALNCFTVEFPHFAVRKFSTGHILTFQTVDKASAMRHPIRKIFDRIAVYSVHNLSVSNQNYIIYRLSDDFVLDTDDEKLVNALGLKFNNTHLKNSYKAGKDAIVEVTGDNSIVATGCPLQASDTLTIKGSGMLTLECSEGMQACIGIETHTGMSYGRWEPGRGPSLNKIIVDGVKVDCHSRVLNFSIGSYGESEVPEIECINGGSLNCPEINGKRIMNRSGAEGLCGSTKRENCAEYEIITDVHDKPQKMLF